VCVRRSAALDDDEGLRARIEAEMVDPTFEHLALPVVEVVRAGEGASRSPEVDAA
jgi:hypothetical protein